MPPLSELIPAADLLSDDESSDEDWLDNEAQGNVEIIEKNAPSVPASLGGMSEPLQSQDEAVPGVPTMPSILQYPGPIPGTSFDLLDMLLDPERLQAEAVALNAGRGLVGKPMDSSTLIQLLRDRLDLDNQVTAFMELGPETKYDNMTRNDEAVLILERIVSSVDMLPTLVVESEKLHFLQRAIQWQICRSFLVFFQWYEDSGPQLARQMARSHQLGDLQLAFPLFAQCVEHVAQYVQCTRTQQQSIARHGSKRRKTTATESDSGVVEVNADLQGLSHIPLHYVDIRLDSKDDRTVSMPCIDRVIGNNDTRLYAVVSEVLFALWCDALLVPSLDRADSLFNTSRRRKDPNTITKTHNKNIVDRSIVRGGMVMALVDTIGEGILASGNIQEFLSSSARMFSRNLKKDDAFANALIRDYSNTMEPLLAHIDDLLEAHPSITGWSDYIGELVSGALADLGDKTLSIMPGGASLKSRKKKRVPRSPLAAALPVTCLEDILIDNSAPHFGALALIC